MITIDKQIESLRALPDNWNSYGAKRVSEVAIKAALDLRLVASVDGGVVVSWEPDEGGDASVEFGPSGDVRYVSWQGK